MCVCVCETRGGRRKKREESLCVCVCVCVCVKRNGAGCVRKMCEVCVCNVADSAKKKNNKKSRENDEPKFLHHHHTTFFSRPLHHNKRAKQVFEKRGNDSETTVSINIAEIHIHEDFGCAAIANFANFARSFSLVLVCKRALGVERGGVYL